MMANTSQGKQKVSKAGTAKAQAVPKKTKVNAAPSQPVEGV